jgi:hypothetical protein
MDHAFTPEIKAVLAKHFKARADEVFERSPLLQYINLKTRSATRGSKSRSSYANLYAIYVLVEDYVQRGFHKKGGYAKDAGARFSTLFKRQRELPFGGKLQNHALNHRMNEEFKKFFPQVEATPILRVVETKRYWINEQLLRIGKGRNEVHIGPAVLEIIDAYTTVKKRSFEEFIATCERLNRIAGKGSGEIEAFIMGLLAPSVDARLFEIVSYAILKHFYHDQKVWFGFQRNKVKADRLKLFKTGRTNANDGGIDFVMQPLGRFFQVTETLDVKKYFLDIDKIERYPISFVIKSEASIGNLQAQLRRGAEKQYGVKAVVDKYMACIEEVINIDVLRTRFRKAVKDGHLKGIIGEIVLQSKVEFNYEDEEQ